MDADRLVAFLPFSFMRAFFAKASPPGSPSAIPAVALTLTNRRAIAVYFGFNAALAFEAAPSHGRPSSFEHEIK